MDLWPRRMASLSSACQRYLEAHRQGAGRALTAFLVAGLLALSVSLGVALPVVVKAWVKAWRAPAPRIGVPQSSSAAPPPPATSTASDTRPDPPQEGDRALSVPRFEWQTAANVHQAATALLDAGRLPDAVALLTRSPETREEATRLGAAALRAGQEALPSLLAAEFVRLAPLLPAVERLSPGPAGRQGQASRPGGVGPTAQAAVEANDLASLGRCLPLPLALALAVNLAIELKATTQTPVDCCRFLLAPLTRSTPLTARLANACIEASPRIPYERCVQVMNRLCQDQFVGPSLTRLFGELRADVRAAAPDAAAWYAGLLGAAQPVLLAAADAEPLAPTATWQAWQALPPGLQRAWAWSVAVEGAKELALDRPETLLHAIPLTATTATLSDRTVSELLGDLVRSHPHWRQSLREFDYDAGLKVVPEVLARLHLTPWLGAVRSVVGRGVAEERRLVEDNAFPWKPVLTSLGLIELPAGLRGSVREPILTRIRFDRPTTGWSKLGEPRVVQALSALATVRDPALRRVNWSGFAGLYAANRGLVPALAGP